MAGVEFGAAARHQFSAIAYLRWRLFVNSLRTNSGRFELGARVFLGLTYAIAGLGAAIGLGVGAFAFTSQNQAQWLTLLFWIVFVLWQMLPIVVSSFAEGIDPSSFLRFPITYPAYFLTLVFYGLFDVATVLGSLCLAGIIVGSSIARPSFFLPLMAICIAFAATNVLLSRTIFAWIERWLARRRSREILGGVFFLMLMSLQAITPLAHRLHGGSSARTLHAAEHLNILQQVSPPGMAGASFAAIARGRIGEAVLFFGLLCAYAVAFLLLLNIRLRAQFRGESLSETASSSPGRRVAHSPSREMFAGLSGPVAAVLEKEIRYLMRSGPVLLTLIVPVFMLLIFGNSTHSGGAKMLVATSSLGFPIGVGYTVLMLTNFMYNSFGSDGAGMQFYFVSAFPIRRIALAKNAFYCAIALAEAALILLAVSLFFQMPTLAMLCATLAWLVFAMPLNLGIGNVFSLIAPRRTEVGSFGRQKPKTVSALAAIGVQIVTIGLGALAIFLCQSRDLIWAAAPLFLLLASVSVVIYRATFLKLDRLAHQHQESILAELGRS